ncbi:reverse transcriptase domain-containing protein [Tanacetum coccineum]
MDRALALQETIGTHDDEAGSSRPKRSRQYETVEKAMLLHPIYSPCIVDWRVLNKMGCVEEIENMLEIKVYEAGSQEEIFKEINEEGFDVYFQGGLRSDDNFNARDYWLSIGLDEELNLSRSLALTIRSPILRVLQKMITYGLCQRTTGYDKLIMKIAKKMRLLTGEVLNSFSAPTYCRALDTTTLRELIDSEGRLIPEDPALGVPRVAIPRGPRPSMQSYELDMYAGVFEHMAGVYDVPLHGAYNPPADETKSYPVGIVKNVVVHIGKLKLLEDFYVIEMEKDPTTSLLVGRGFLATASAIIDCKKAKIAVIFDKESPEVLRIFAWTILG